MMKRAVLLVSMGLALVGAGAPGCSTAMDADAPAVNTIITPPDAQADDGGSAPDAPVHGLAPSQVAGSPLCNASTWMGCYPDDTHVSRDRECNLGGGNLGGAADASAGSDTATLACRVQPSSGGVLAAPVCGLAGPGADGVACRGPADCTAGFECVGGGVCRRYCCAGSCSNQNQFCDIQVMTLDSSTKVPVCMPLDDCGLLDQPSDAGSCAAGETCSVVRDNGARSCVATGGAQAGDECDTDHCAEGLACLGSAGARRCYVLCHTGGGSPECSHKQSCKGGLPLFLVPGVGICE